jgi:hypothetical protein
MSPQRFALQAEGAGGRLVRPIGGMEILTHYARTDQLTVSKTPCVAKEAASQVTSRRGISCLQPASATIG